MKKEVWKPVINWEKYYLVSNYGRVYSLPRKIKVLNPWGAKAERNFKGKLLKIYGTEYPTVTFSRPGKRAYYYVHDLVTMMFLGLKPKDFEVCHNDGNPRNNRLENLRYDTRSANSLDRHKHGTFDVPKGIYAPSAKLSIKQVNYIRKIGDRIAARTLAKRYGVSHGRILAIRNGESYL